jgi:hypothetical protein
LMKTKSFGISNQKRCASTLHIAGDLFNLYDDNKKYL